jgi:transcriptional regulator with XRE-family HTH domain
MHHTVRKILSLADSKCISHVELADLLSKKEHILYDWQIGIREPTIRDIVLLSEYFNVTCDYLLKDEIVNNSVEEIG